MKRTRATTTTSTIDKLEVVFKALADKPGCGSSRLLGNNEVCVCHIHDSLGLPQPTVSRHLAYLRRSGLVMTRRDGVWMHYKVSTSLDPAVAQVVDAAVEALTRVPTTTKDREAVSAFVRPALRPRGQHRRILLCSACDQRPMTIERAAAGDLPEVLKLLEHHHLPLDGVASTSIRWSWQKTTDVSSVSPPRNSTPTVRCCGRSPSILHCKGRASAIS